MRIPLTKYGLPQVVILPALIIFAMAALIWLGGTHWAILTSEAIFAIVLIFIVAFFRDPARIPPVDDMVLLAPADGTIADIETVEEKKFIKDKALRIGIFLSIFDVHINRAPCNVKVEKIVYKKGGFKDARDSQAESFNESNDLFLTRKTAPFDKLIVRQISGAVARRIVCEAKEGQELTGGQKFGMIKFGSRTELYVPDGERVKCLVKVGDKVKAGLTLLIEYKR